MALGDKVDTLLQNVAALTERLDEARKAIDAVHAAQRDGERAAADLRRETECEIALLKRDVEAWKTWKEEFDNKRDELSRRVWSFGPGIVSAIVNVALAAIVAYFVSRR